MFRSRAPRAITEMQPGRAARTTARIVLREDTAHLDQQLQSNARADTTAYTVRFPILSGACTRVHLSNRSLSMMLQHTLRNRAAFLSNRSFQGSTPFYCSRGSTHAPGWTKFGQVCPSRSRAPWGPTGTVQACGKSLTARIATRARIATSVALPARPVFATRAITASRARTRARRTRRGLRFPSRTPTSVASVLVRYDCCLGEQARGTFWRNSWAFAL